MTDPVLVAHASVLLRDRQYLADARTSVKAKQYTIVGTVLFCCHESHRFQCEAAVAEALRLLDAGGGSH